MPSGIYQRKKHWKWSMKSKEKFSKINMGKHLSKKTRKRMSISKTGNKHWNWQGGLTNYARKLFLNANRRAMVKNAIGSFTFGEWEILKKQYNFICPSCGKGEPEIKLTFDHIIPLSKGGSNNIENIQPLCRSCNCKKHTKIIKYERGNKT